MLSGEGKENGQNKSVGLISKKKKLCTCSRLFCTFLCRCFARPQRETRPETSQLHVLWRKCCMFSCSLFFAATHFHLSDRQHFSFSHRRYKIFMLFFQQNLSPLFLTSRFSAFSVIHVNVDIKIKSKERIDFIVVILLSLKVRVAM